MSAKRNRENGKAAERAVAKAFGAKRMWSLNGEDLAHPVFSIEVKSRHQSVVHAFMEQARSNCPVDRTPLVVVHHTRRPHDNDLVVVRVSDFLRIAGLDKDRSSVVE